MKIRFMARPIVLGAALVSSLTAGRSWADDKIINIGDAGPSQAPASVATPRKPAVDLPPELKGARTPLPSSTALADATRRANAAFSEVLRQAQSPADRTNAAKKMFQAGVEEQDSVVRYAMLLLARNTAAKAGNTPLAFDIAGMISDLYTVQSSRLKQEAAVILVTVIDSDDQRQEFVDEAGPAVDEAVLTNDFASATSMLRLASTQARAISGNSSETFWNGRVRDLQEAQAAYSDASKAIEATTAGNADPESNTKAGKYLCFQQNQWSRGLAMLVAGSDEPLKALAGRELASATDDPARVAIADEWWSASERLSGLAKRNVRQHAASMYDPLLPTLTGLARIQSAKRVEEAKGLNIPPVPEFQRTITIEAFVDGDSELHVRSNGMQWTHKQSIASKPGKHSDGTGNEATYVNGRPWFPKWNNSRPTGKDESDFYPLRLAPDARYLVEVVAIGQRRGANTVERRDEIRVSTNNGTGIIEIPDSQNGPRWYRLKISRYEAR